MTRFSIVLFLIILCASRVSYAQWQALGGPPGGNASDLEIDPVTGDIYVLVNSEYLFVSDDDAATWSPLPASANINPADFLIDGELMYAVNFSGFFKSEDKGQTWVRVTTITQFTGASHLIKHPTANALFIFGSNGLYVSINEGVTWKQINPESTVSVVVAASGDLYFADSEGIGKHPMPLTGDLWATENTTIVHASASNSIRLAVSGSDIFAATQTDVLKTSDNGVSWPSVKTATITESNFYDPVWAVSGNGIYLFTSNNAYFSSNGGTLWEVKAYPSGAYSGGPAREVKFVSNSVGFAATYSDGVFRTTDGATSWTFATNGINFFPAVDIILTTSGRIICTGSEGGFWFSDDSGVSWNHKVALDNSTTNFVKLPSDTLLALGFQAMRFSADHGTTWTVNASSVTLYDVTFNTTFSPGRTYFGSGASRISRSTDGNNWTDLSITGLPGSYTGYSLTQDNTGNLYATIYSSGKYYIYKIEGITENGTTGTATLLNLPLVDTDESNFNPLSELFISNNKLYVSTFNYIYISADQGANWSAVNFRKYSLFPLKKGSLDAIAAGTPGMLYTTQDDGKTWVGTSMPQNAALNYIQNIVEDTNGDYYAAAYSTPALKFTDELLLSPASLPPYIDFNWQPTNGPYGGFLQRLIVDNDNNAYTIASGIIYKTPPAFDGWADVSDGNFFNDLQYVASDHKLFGMTSSTLLTSADGGDTWDLLNNENLAIRRHLRRCPNGDWVLSNTTNAIYVSTDDGLTFGSPKYTSSGEIIADLLVTSTGAIIAYQQVSTPLAFSAIISTDRGVTWNPLPLNGPSTEFTRLSADANGNIYSSMTPFSKSPDNGQTWIPIVVDPLHTVVSSKVFVAPSGDMYVAAATDTIYTENTLFKSSDSGVSWVGKGVLPPGITSVGDIQWVGTRMALATTQGAFISDDDGATFAPRSEPIAGTQYADLDVLNPSRLIIATTSGAGYTSDDFANWTPRDTRMIRQFFRTPDGSLMGYSSTYLYSSDDEGDTWTAVSKFPRYFQNLTTLNGTTYYAGSFNELFVSTSPATWTEVVVTGLPESFLYTNLALDQNGRLYVMVFNRTANLNECYRIDFGSATKIDAIESPRRVLQYNNKVYIYESTGSISVTTDGETWTSQSAPTGIDFIIAGNNYYFITQTGGILWLSRDEGRTWQSVGLTGAKSSDRFQHVAVNEFNGYAYGTLVNSVVRKSANIVILPETTAPQVSSLQPVNGAVDVPAASTLKITFNEPVVTVAGKKIRIFDADNTLTPVEIIDASTGIQNEKTFTFTPASAFLYTETYFVTVDNGAFKDIFNNAFPGISNESSWRFTVEDVPDVTKPVINYSHTTPTFTKGEAKTIVIAVTDETGGSGLNPATVKVHYRGITSSDNPTAAAMTVGTGDNFEIGVNEAWLDELGLEFRFEASDHAGNVQTSPADGTYHRGYIAFPAAQNPSLPSSVLSAGGQVANYRIFSIPHKLGDAKISTVFDELSAQEVKTDYRILHFNTESNQYTEYPSMSTISRGLGYWVNIKNPPTIAVENAATPENSKEQLFSLALKPGWNQVGNPYPFPVSWNAVRTAAGDGNIGVLKTFQGSGWTEDDIMNPFEGGFVFLDGASSTNVILPFTAKSSSGRKMDDTPGSAEGWILPLVIRNDEFQTIGGVGMHPAASRGFDRYDDAIPPKVFDLPEIAFAHEEHSLKQFTRDVVPPDDEFTWDFTVKAGQGIASLTWDVQAARSLPAEIYLFDEREQEVVDMKEEDHCTIPPGKPAAFRIYYGVALEDIKPSRITLGKPYPNPFTDVSTISFTLPENHSGAYNVSLDVYDQLGRKVVTVARGEFPSGFYVGEWKPEQGTMGASFYLYRLTVSGRDSHIVLTQKIITKK